MADYQGEKFRQFLVSNNIKVADAARLLGVSRQNMYQYFGSKNLNRETVDNILTVFGATENEIFTEKEPVSVFRSPETEYKRIRDYDRPNPRIEANPLYTASDPADLISFQERFYENPDGTLEMIVPVVPHKAQAGYLRGFKDPEYYERFETVSIKVDKRHRATYIGFEVVGDSMITTDPELFYMMALPGWTAIGRELQRHHWRDQLHIRRVVNWIIVHSTEGILIKNIKAHDVERGIITVHSLNPKYKDQELFLDDVAQLFSVVKFEIDR
jgi:transcriptional regulator with XRE-family HTH domain